MDKSKVLEFFDGANVKGQIHIVGCGAIGSHIAEELARIGCENIHLWDFDTVSPHNITNQMFRDEDIGKLKVDAVANMMVEINPDLQGKLTLHPDGLKEPFVLNGYIFMCVDKIALRKQIVEANKYNPNAKCVFDFRMRLTDAQHYFAEFSNHKSVQRLLDSMNFTDEEAAAATPKSACHVELSVVYTVKAITAYGVSNFVRYCQTGKAKSVILADMNLLTLDVFD